MAGDATITIRRTSGTVVGNEPWRVFVDGIPHTTLSIDDPVVVPILPGRHTLSIQGIMWGSDIETVTVQSGEHLEFECRSAFWRDWQKKKTRFWWASPFLVSIFRPCLVRVDGQGTTDDQKS